MTRTVGATNVHSFESRTQIATTATQEIRHLARQANDTPREQFKALLRHQRSFLKWIDTRHQELLDAKKQLNPSARGPKDGVYRKYRWYAEQQLLLEAINAFEAFYKNTFINLGSAIQSYVPPDKVKGTVDAKTLWATANPNSTVALIFEHQLFHNLNTVDDLTSLLVGARRYQPDNQNSLYFTRSKVLQVIFQMRHTLSHNQDCVTQSDAAKFAALGYSVNNGEILDPSSDHLGDVVREVLLDECERFTDWLLDKAANYLNKRNHDFGAVLLETHRDQIFQCVGTHAALRSLAWQ